MSTTALTAPVVAGVVDYPNGTTNTSSIVLIDNSTQLQVLTGSATQSGAISESGGSWGLEKIGAGTLTLSGTNTYSGGTTITGGTLAVASDSALGATSGTVTLNGGMLQFGGGVTARDYVVQAGGGTFSAGDPNVSAPGNQSTITGTISGPGHLTFTGFGGTTLTGNNTYTGGTTIYEGAILVGNGGTTGSIVGDVVSGVGTGNAGINFDRSDNITFSGNISGLGYVAQYGTGTLTLTGNNTYAAYTAVLSGRLAFANDNNVGIGDIKIYGGTVQYNASFTSALNYQLSSGSFDTNGNTVSLSGNVLTMSGVNVAAGYGGLTKIGAGTLVLTGSDTYQGPTLISSGTLQIGNGGATGSTGVGTSVIDNGQLVFNRSDNIVFGSLISGTGSLTQAGPGTLTLAAANTYTGGTTVSGGTLQLGVDNALAASGGLNLFGTFDLNGHSQTIGDLLTGNSGGGLAVNGGTLTINQATDSNYLGSLSGSGAIVINGPAALSLVGPNGTTASITVNGGTLRVRSIGGGNDLTINGGTFFVNNRTMDLGQLSGAGGTLDMSGSILTFTSNADSTFFGAVVDHGVGTFIKNGNGTLTLAGAGSNATAVQVLGGALQYGNGGTSGGFFGGSITDDGTLIFNRSDNISYNGNISGTGGVTQAGTGTTILTGANTYSNITVISAGTLQIGNGGTAGSITGNVANSGVLIFNRSDAVTYAGIISGNGIVKKVGSGILTLSGTNTYTGNTSVNAGTLNVTGKIGSSSVSIANGAILSGTGTVGATTIASGGSLNPGSSTTPGTLSVLGNLTLASGANYLDTVTPVSASLTNVSGTASINGNFIASVAPGTYTFGQRFTVLTAGGGLSGTFATLSGIPAFVTGQLSYDANNAYLIFRPIALTPFLSNATGNQHSVVTAIDAAVLAGAPPSGGFLNLYGLTGPALNSALDQISGQVGPNVANAVGQSFLSFISMAAQGGSGTAGNFAPGSVYGRTDAPHRAQLGSGETRLWGAAYGGHAGLSGDSTSGAAGLSSNNAGLIGGADIRMADGLIAGVTVGVGRQWFHSGNGTSDSDDFMIGLYGRADIDVAYIAASLGYGWHQVTTVRTITVSGTDMLQGKQDPNDFGGRIEAGWRVPLDDVTSVIPYGAFAGESFESPAYAETAISGASTFALSYGAQTTALGRSELGAHLNRDYALETGTLTADLRAAWAHQLDDQPFIQASFQGLAGSAFQVAGVHPARDTALLGVDLEVQNSSGLFFGIHGEGQFGAGTTLVEGVGNFGWRW